MEFSVHICEYNRSNADYETIYRPEGSGDYLFLLFKTVRIWVKRMEFRRMLFFIHRTRKQLMS